MVKFAAPHHIRALIADGMALPADRPAVTGLVRYFHRLLAQRTPAANDEFVRVFHAIADASSRRVRPVPALACRRQCALCCRAHVSVLAPEVFALARSIRNPGRHAARHARLRQGAADNVEMSLEARRAAQISCSFIDDDLCSVYASRPLTCRMFASFDLAACIRTASGGADNIPQPGEFHTIRSVLAVTAFAAMKGAGLPLASHELNRSLVVLLDDPGREAAWYAGTGDLAEASGERDRLSAEFLESVDRTLADTAL